MIWKSLVIREPPRLTDKLKRSGADRNVAVVKGASIITNLYSDVAFPAGPRFVGPPSDYYVYGIMRHQTADNFLDLLNFASTD